MDADVGVGGGAVVDLGVGLFLDGGDDDGEPVGARGVEQQEREAAVAGDEAEVRRFSHLGGCTMVIVTFPWEETLIGAPSFIGGSNNHASISARILASIAGDGDLSIETDSGTPSVPITKAM